MTESIASPVQLAVALPVLEGNGAVTSDSVGATCVALREGQWFFGRGDVHVSALVGASLAVVLWSARQGWGGACCFAQATPCADDGEPGPNMERHGQHLMRLLDDRLTRAGCDWSDVELSLAGGAHHHDGDVGILSVDWAQQWASKRSLVPRLQDVGGRVLRRLTFRLADGTVRIAHGGRMHSQEI